MISFLYVPGPVNFALFACSWSAIADPGPIVKASVGNELLGPKLPEKVSLLRMRQKPPLTVRDLGLSIVAVGCGAAALAKRIVTANIVEKNCPWIVLVPMVNGIVNPDGCSFQQRLIAVWARRGNCRKSAVRKAFQILKTSCLTRLERCPWLLATVSYASCHK